MHTITVSLPDRRVVIQDASGTIVRSYPVYVGSSKFPTPTGRFQILPDDANLSNDIAYTGLFLPFHEYPDPDIDPNIQAEQIAVAGFHGWKYGPEDDVVEQSNPGWMTSTEGCVQMTNEDVADFASIVQLGDPVIVLDLPIAQIEHLNNGVPRITSERDFGS